MDSDEQKPTPETGSVGQQLTQAREKQGLSQKDIADAQHLRVSIVQAIEEGRYEQIDSEIFLKGYVRAYADQVGANVDELMQALDIELEPLREVRHQKELEDPLVGIERRRRKKRQLAKVVVLLTVLGAVGYAVWTMMIEPGKSLDQATDRSIETSSEQGRDNSDREDGDQESVKEEVAPGAAPTEPPPLTPDEEGQAVAAVDQDSIVQAPEASVANVEAAVDEKLPAELQLEDDAPGVTEDDQETTPADQVMTEPLIQPDPVFAESARPELVSPRASLSMSFGAECWVQVTDAAGAKLVASLQRSGDRVEVSGSAPLSVIIGAVDAVDAVSFDGESVDLSDYRVINNRTEFTLTL